MTEIVYQQLLDSEESYLNTTFWDIHPLFLLVHNGDTQALREQLHIQLERFPEGRITKDTRKQLEYLAVSLVNSFMIAAIQGGAYPPFANGIADQALRKLSRIHSVSEIPDLINEAAIALCELACRARNENTGNIHVEKAKHYISTHLTQEIHTADIAEAAGISPWHLCRLFKSLTGMTMREYLIRERVEAAALMLSTGSRSIPETASLLRFCDQSYFTAVFGRIKGMTPKQYRDLAQR